MYIKNTIHRIRRRVNILKHVLNIHNVKEKAGFLLSAPDGDEK